MAKLPSNFFLEFNNYQISLKTMKSKKQRLFLAEKVAAVGVALLFIVPSLCAADSPPSVNSTHSHSPSHNSFPSWMKSDVFKVVMCFIGPLILTPIFFNITIGFSVAAYLLIHMSSVSRVKVSLPLLAAVSSFVILIGEHKLWSAIVALVLAVVQLAAYTYIFRSDGRAANAKWSKWGCYYTDLVDGQKVRFLTPAVFFQFVVYLLNIVAAVFVFADIYVSAFTKAVVGTGVATIVLNYLSALCSIHAASGHLSLLENGQRTPLRRNLQAAPRGMELIFERVHPAVELVPVPPGPPPTAPGLPPTAAAPGPPPAAAPGLPPPDAPGPSHAAIGVAVVVAAIVIAFIHG